MEILYNSEIILVFSTRNCKKTLQFKPNISTASLSSRLYSSRLPHWPPRTSPLFWFCMTVCKLSLHFQVWTKIYSHILKAELFYFVAMFWTPSPGDSISVALRQLLQRSRRESQAIHKFATKGAGSLNIKDQVSLNLLLSYAPQLSGTNPVSSFTLFLTFLVY